MSNLNYRSTRLISMRIAGLTAIDSYSPENFDEVKTLLCQFADNQEATRQYALRDVQAITRLLPSLESIGAYRYMVDRIAETQHDFEMIATEFSDGSISVEEEEISSDTDLDLTDSTASKDWNASLGLENYQEVSGEEILECVQEQMSEYVAKRKLVTSLESYLSGLGEDSGPEPLIEAHEKLRALYHQTPDGLEAGYVLRNKLSEGMEEVDYNDVA